MNVPQCSLMTQNGHLREISRHCDKSKTLNKYLHFMSVDCDAPFGTGDVSVLGREQQNFQRRVALQRLF